MCRLLLVKRVIRASFRRVDRWSRVSLFPKSLCFRSGSLPLTNHSRIIRCALIRASPAFRSFASYARHRTTLPKIQTTQFNEALHNVMLEFTKHPTIDSALQLVRDCGTNNLMTALEVYHILIRSKVTPTTELITLLAKASTEANQPQAAIPFLWDELIRLSLPIDDECFRWLTNACNKAGDHETASKLLAFAKERQLELLANPASCKHLCLAFRTGKKLDKALEMLQLSEQVNPKHDLYLYSLIFTMCGDAKNLQEGQRLQNHLLSHHVVLDVYCVVSLITMYSRCGSLADAIAVFNHYLTQYPKDVTLWNAMITAYRDHRETDKALQLFDDMIAKGIAPDQMTVTVAINACSTASADESYLTRVKNIHRMISQFGVEFDTFMATSLIDCYAKWGSLRDAVSVFKSLANDQRQLAVWNALINGYATNGHGAKALEAFITMLRAQILPDAITLTAVLHGCAKAGLADEALLLFGEMNDKLGIVPDAIHAACVAVALVNANRFRELLQFLEKLPSIDEATLSYPLTTCSDLRVVNAVYSLSQRHNLRLNHIVVAALIHTYAKNELLDEAIAVFNHHQHTHHEVAVWNSMINAYAMNGRGVKALETFQNMLQAGVKPDTHTMLAVLNGCAKSGLADSAISIFKSMEQQYGIRPDERHRIQIRNAFMRSGRSDELFRYTLSTEATLPR